MCWEKKEQLWFPLQYLLLVGGAVLFIVRTIFSNDMRLSLLVLHILPLILCRISLDVSNNSVFGMFVYKLATSRVASHSLGMFVYKLATSRVASSVFLGGSIPNSISFTRNRWYP